MARQQDTSGKFVETHGLTATHEYAIWGNMLYRCNTPSSHVYDSYGGRGIKVCSDWHSFENFISDMGIRPSISHSIDRDDVNGDYTPDNCRWATKTEQSRNKRNSVYLIVDGEKMQIDAYCERYGIHAATIKSRFHRGWSNEKIINTPISKKG